MSIRASEMTLVVNDQILGKYFLKEVEPLLTPDFREGFHAVLQGVEHPTTIQLSGYIEKERAQELWDFFYPLSRWNRFKRWIMKVVVHAWEFKVE